MLVYLLLVSAVEAIALLATVFVVRKRERAKTYSIFKWYLVSTAFFSDIAYVVLRGLSLLSILPDRAAANTWAVTYNVGVVTLSVLVFLLVRDLYSHAMAHLPGMESLGTLILYGSLVVSVVMVFGVVFSPHPSGYRILYLALYQIERCSYILVLCLFTFFALTAQKLGMTYGSRAFGVSFGIAILATDHLVMNALNWGQSEAHMLAVNLIGEFVQVGAIALWMVYFLKAEPERRLVTVDMHSPLVRWNEVAQMLGNPAGRVVVSSPSTFVPEVREVVASATAGGAQRPPNLGLAANATSR